MIMHLKYSSLPAACAEEIERHSEGLFCLYDCIFTSREKTYPVGHLAICGNTIVGYSCSSKGSAADCARHLETCLKVGRFTDLSIKLFTDLKKYTERLDQLQKLQYDNKDAEGISNTLKAISL